MTTTLLILKRGIIAGILLCVGFLAGWFSAIVLGGRIPLDGDIAAALGPGRGANQATPQQLRTQFSVFWEVWNLVDGEFYHRTPLDQQRMIQGAIKGMLDSLGDQYPVYQAPELASQTHEHMQGKLGGIGTYLRITDGKAYLWKPVKNAPAALAGLRQDHEIVKIDDQDVATLIAGLDINQAAVKVASKLRGEPGTSVRLTLRRRPNGAPFAIMLTRAEIVIGALREKRPNTFLLGETTYGKGSVQNIHGLSDGSSARITIAHWLTPDKTEIHKIGITPQYVVPYTEDAASTVPCVADHRPAEGQVMCADSQLAWAIKLLVSGQAPPLVTPTPAP